MRCKECDNSEVLKIRRPENVKFICNNGHVWFEDYKDNGGIQKRPQSYTIRLEDIFFPSEKVLYKKVLEEIAMNQSFFTSSSAEEITAYLIGKCEFDKEAIYKLFKKITKFNNRETIDLSYK